jgi:hypothetical protein
MSCSCGVRHAACDWARGVTRVVWLLRFRFRRRRPGALQSASPLRVARCTLHVARFTRPGITGTSGAGSGSGPAEVKNPFGVRRAPRPGGDSLVLLVCSLALSARGAAGSWIACSLLLQRSDTALTNRAPTQRTPLGTRVAACTMGIYAKPIPFPIRANKPIPLIVMV